MTQIQQNRYDQLLRRVADLKGTGSKVNDALTELFPMFDVENCPSELLLLMGTRICLGGDDLAAGGALQINQGMLRNPPDSGAIITVLEIRCGSDGGDTYVYGPTVNVLPNAGRSAFTDTRVFAQGTIGQVLSTALLVEGPNFGIGRAGAGTDLIVAVPRGLGVLTPGSAFSISATTADRAFTFTFSWLERTVQPSELSL